MIAEPHAAMRLKHANRTNRMTGGQHRHRLIRTLTACVCCAILVAYADITKAESNDDASLRKILTSVANTPLNETPFVAINTSGLLAAPIESRGTLSFSRDGRIEKHTTSPIDERTTISTETVRIERKGELTDELSFADKPALTAYAQGLRAILGGNTAPLYEHFLLTLDGDYEQWSMTLRPKSMRLQTVLSSLVVTGAEGLIGSIQTVKTSGDVDTLTILPNSSADSPAGRSQ